MTNPLLPRRVLRKAPFLPTAIALALWAPQLLGQITGVSDSGMRRTALRVLDLETKRQEKTGSASTIDSLLGLYSDSVVYEHPGAGAVVRGKAALRAGMLQYVGSIRHVHSDPPHILEGHGVVVVRTDVRMDVLDGTKWVPVSRRGLRIIEFDSHGLVRRLIDYPW